MLKADENIKTWMQMLATKCRDCKWFCNSKNHYLCRYSNITVWGYCVWYATWLNHPFITGECPHFEWQDRLTREDFIDYG